jgi:hypothetical protein
MFDKAKEKITSWWNNPYWAPVTEPLKMIGAAAYAPNKQFVACIKDGMEARYGNDDTPALARIFKEFWDIDNVLPWLSGTVGAGAAAIVAGVCAGIGISGAGMGALAIGAGAVVAAGAAAIATPFAVMGVLAFAGASLAAICLPYGLARGCVKALKYRTEQKTQAAAVQAVPAVKNAAPDIRKTATQLYKTLRDMPAEIQAPVLKDLSEKFAASGTGAAQSVMKAIDAMPEAERAALVKELQTKLSATFDAVANDEAKQSVTLQQPAPTMHTIKLKTRV